MRGSPRVRQADGAPRSHGLEGPEAGARHRRESAGRLRVGGAGRRHREGRAPRFPGGRAGGGVFQRALQPAGAEVDAGEAPAVWGGGGGPRREMWRGRAAAGRPGGGSALASGSLYCVSDLGMARPGVFLALCIWGHTRIP